MNKTIYLVDAYAHIYRGYHAVPPLNDAAGRPSNALFAMGRFLMTLEKELKPEFGAFVFDKGPPAKRLALHPEYKAHRPPMPDELKSQVGPIRELVAAAGWKILEREGSEADDIIAAAAVTLAPSEVMVVSNDKDLSQIVDDRVKLLVTLPKGGGKFLLRGLAEVKEKFGVGPEQIVDYLAMVGDSSDNIPGVPGIGPKTAATLLQEHGSLDRVLADLGLVKQAKVREKLAAANDILALNRQLISLDLSLVSEAWAEPEKLRLGSPDTAALLGIADSYNLKSLASELSNAFSRGLGQGVFEFS